MSLRMVDYFENSLPASAVLPIPSVSKRVIRLAGDQLTRFNFFIAQGGEQTAAENGNLLQIGTLRLPSIQDQFDVVITI
jgi:hypothetical protein